MSLFKKVAARPWHRSQGLCSRCSAFFRALMFLFGHTIPKADRLLVDAGSATGLVKFTESTDPPSWSSRLTKLKQGTRKPHAGSSVSPPALDKRCQKAALDALRCVLWMSHRNWPSALYTSSFTRSAASSANLAWNAWPATGSRSWSSGYRAQSLQD